MAEAYAYARVAKILCDCMSGVISELLKSKPDRDRLMIMRSHLIKAQKELDKVLQIEPTS